MFLPKGFVYIPVQEVKTVLYRMREQLTEIPSDKGIMSLTWAPDQIAQLHIRCSGLDELVKVSTVEQLLSQINL